MHVGVGLGRRCPYIPPLRPAAAHRATEVDDSLLAADAVIVAGDVAANPEPHNLYFLMSRCGSMASRVPARARGRLSRAGRANVPDSEKSGVTRGRIRGLGRAKNRTARLQICPCRYLIYRAGSGAPGIAAGAAGSGGWQRFHGRAWRALRVDREHGELFVELRARAGGANRRPLALDQGLKGVPAVPADVFEDRHKVAQAFRPAESSV